MSHKIRAAIIGGSEDGKTFLATGLSRGWWARDGFRSIVFDPYAWENDWGPQAKVFTDFDRWRAVIDRIRPEQKFAAIWDEATDNGGRDRDNAGLLTAIRHNCDRMLVIGHGYSAMLPIMRGSLTDVILALRDPDEARDWARLFVDEAVMQATKLKQYEFLHKRKHCPARVLRYTRNQIEAGITL